MSHKIAPSILSADFLNLAADVEMINNSEADWFHCDVMDGTFVPNISFGFPPVIKQISKIAKKPLDVHLMIVNPDKYINEVKDAGAYMMNVHYEACTHLHRVVGAIHDAGMKAGGYFKSAYSGISARRYSSGCGYDTPYVGQSRIRRSEIYRTLPYESRQA